jgi:hypothetical protein
MSQDNTTELPLTEAKLRFMCEQLREWGGLPEAEIRRIYEAEMKRRKSH